MWLGGSQSAPTAAAAHPLPPGVYALFEERVIDLPTGRFLNPNIEQYKILGAAG